MPFSVVHVLLMLVAGLRILSVNAITRPCTQLSAYRRAEQHEAEPDTPISILLALTTPNVEGAAESLLDISDPASPNYARHWTARQAAEAFAPDRKHIQAVLTWLKSSGVHPSRLRRSHSKGYLHFNTTVREAQRVFNTAFRHAADGQLACDALYLSDTVDSAIEFIVAVTRNTTSTGTAAKRRTKHLNTKRLQKLSPKDTSTPAVTVANCTEYMTPTCLRELYGIPTGNAVHPNNSFGICEISWQTWLPDDLDKFFTMFQPELQGQRPVVEGINGGYSQTAIQITPFNIEADFDFEYAMALTNQPVIDLQVGDKYQQGTINNMLAAFDAYYCGALDHSLDSTNFPDTKPGGYNHTVDCGTLEPPSVISISWAYPEASFPPEYLQRQCLEFLKLGLMGVTVITGSGDNGVATAGTSPCLGPVNASDFGGAQRFNPAWPAACPWVTTVGGTQRAVVNGSTVAAEAAYNTALGNTTVSSGGGFSNVFPVPAYQRAVVSAYKCAEQTHLGQLVAAGLFNVSGRGFPDVSAFASAYLAIIDGTLHTVYGTSASALVFASIIALINGERLDAGKSGTVGFLNPVLYAHPEVFIDIETGSNTGCGVDEAFRAVHGWDPVTGLGTPGYSKLRDLLVSL